VGLSARSSSGPGHRRRQRCAGASKFQDEDWQVVDKLIRDDFSPEQISHRMDLEYTLQISHETIYRHIYDDKRPIMGTCVDICIARSHTGKNM
jgi:IS30 family transposase